MSPSAPQMSPQAHDLLWGLQAEALDGQAPAWVVEELQQQRPVVVRRAPSTAGWIAVGVRGARRDQRYACWLAEDAVTQCLRPEQLCSTALASPDAPNESVLRMLVQITPFMDALGQPWGVTGSAGYQLATGLAVLHPDSDLDLLLRTPEPFSRQQAALLLARLERLACRVDVQLETPAGAIALREWAGSAAQVLLKSAEGPRLVRDPWQEALSV